LCSLAFAGRAAGGWRAICALFLSGLPRGPNPKRAVGKGKIRSGSGIRNLEGPALCSRHDCGNRPVRLLGPRAEFPTEEGPGWGALGSGERPIGLAWITPPAAERAFQNLGGQRKMYVAAPWAGRGGPAMGLLRALRNFPTGAGRVETAGGRLARQTPNSHGGSMDRGAIAKPRLLCPKARKHCCEAGIIKRWTILNRGRTRRGQHA